MSTFLYDYNMETGEYIGSHEAQKRPNGEVILVALGATPVVPPEIPDGYAAVWADEEWSLVEDHRQKYDARGVKTGGTPYWLDGDTYQSATRYMTELGPLPDGALLVQPEQPEPTLEEAKATKTTELDAEASSRITVGFWYADEEVFDGNLHFSFGTEDQINFSDTMTGASLALTAANSLADLLPSTVTWNGYEDEAHANLVTVTFTATQFLSFWSYAQTSHKQAILDIVRGLKALVVSAESVEDVQAIVWPVDDGADADGADDVDGGDVDGEADAADASAD